ncbi:MAG TPA: hypothetical protein VM347_34940 [Nonomuraea sp.]|nr:hypothetical protein [Nonomuraea sp.]
MDPPDLDRLNSVSPPVIDTMDGGLRPEVIPAAMAARTELDELIIIRVAGSLLSVPASNPLPGC